MGWKSNGEVDGEMHGQIEMCCVHLNDLGFRLVLKTERRKVVLTFGEL